jgi:two-component system chemotaxis response regulator CheB
MPALPSSWNDGAEHFTRLTCPDCGGSLTVRTVGPQAAVVVFECRIGHAFGLDDLLLAKEEVVEAALWRSVYVLQELADLPDLEAHAVADPSPTACRARTTQATQHANQLRRLIAVERRLTLGMGDSGRSPSCTSRRPRRDLFAFGGSAGGLEALVAILERLPSDFAAAIGITLHRSPLAIGSRLVNVLARAATLPVSEPADGEPIAPRQCYLAPPDHHLTIDGSVWRVTRGPAVHRMRPAVDPFFESAARWYGARTCGIVLSGAGVDGVVGCVAITAAGGLTIAQRPEESRQPSMPLRAITGDDVSLVLETEEIAALLPSLAAGREVRDAGV